MAGAGGAGGGGAGGGGGSGALFMRGGVRRGMHMEACNSISEARSSEQNKCCRMLDAMLDMQ